MNDINEIHTLSADELNEFENVVESLSRRQLNMFMKLCEVEPFMSQRERLVAAKKLSSL